MTAWSASLNSPATIRLKPPIAERAVVRCYPRDLHPKSLSIVLGHVTFMPIQSACAFFAHLYRRVAIVCQSVNGRGETFRVWLDYQTGITVTDDV